MPRKTKLQKEQELRAKGRAILAEKRRKVARKAVQGIVPSRGLWVFNPESRRLSGKIVMVRRKGQLVVKGFYGERFDLEPEKVERCGYVYGPELPPGEWLFGLADSHAVPTQEDLARYDVNEVDEEGNPVVVRQPKVITLSPCLCGCGAECKSRFVVGHDAKFKSKLKKASKPLVLMPEQMSYLEAATWMTQELWRNVNKKKSKRS